MVEKHPEMVSRIKIGSTVEDNPLYVLKVKIIEDPVIHLLFQNMNKKVILW